jgi:WD40 repeat protein
MVKSEFQLRNIRHFVDVHLVVNGTTLALVDMGRVKYPNALRRVPEHLPPSPSIKPKKAVSSNFGKTATMATTTQPRVRGRPAHTAGPTFLTYTPDGTKLVTVGSNNTTRVYKTGFDGEPTNIDDCPEQNMGVSATVCDNRQDLLHGR